MIIDQIRIQFFTLWVSSFIIFPRSLRLNDHSLKILNNSQSWIELEPNECESVIVLFFALPLSFQAISMGAHQMQAQFLSRVNWIESLLHNVWIPDGHQSTFCPLAFLPRRRHATSC